MSYVTARRWFKRFRNGDFSLQEDLRSGRPTEIYSAELKHVLESGSDQSTRSIASSSHQLVNLRRSFDWLNNLITGDEMWCLYANFKRKYTFSVTTPSHMLCKFLKKK